MNSKESLSAPATTGRAKGARLPRHVHPFNEDRQRYELRELMAQCDLAVPPPEGLEAWEALEPMGGEHW